MALRTPDPPPTPTATFQPQTDVVVAWYAPADGGSPILEFQIQYAINPSFTDAMLISSGKLGRYTVSVVMGMTAYFRVRARNAVGWGAWSPSRSLWIPTAPSQPVAPNLVLHIPKSVYAWWGAPADNGAGIQYYHVEALSRNDVRKAITPQTENFTWFHNLDIGETYLVRVQAENTQGRGPWSAYSEVRIPYVPNLMGAPTLHYTPATTMLAVWTAPYDGGSGITGYDLQYSDDPNFSNYKLASTQGFSVTVSDLTPGKYWYFRTRAKNSQGDGPWGHVASRLVVFGPRVYMNGFHKHTVPYVKHNGAWKLAIPYVKDAGTYKFAGG